MKSMKVNFNPNGIAKLPKTSGVYVFGCGRQIDYVGSSGNIQRRVKQHAKNGMNSCYIKALSTKTRKQAFDLERTFIGNNCPTNNKVKPNHCKSFFDSLFG